jgi:hypothetical protein
MTDDLSFNDLIKFEDLRSIRSTPANTRALVRDWVDRPAGPDTDVITAQLAGFYCEDVSGQEQKRFWIRSKTNGSDRGFGTGSTPGYCWDTFLTGYWDPSINFEQAYFSLLKLDSNEHKFDQWGVSFIGYNDAAAMLILPQYTCLLIKDSKLYTASADTQALAMSRAYIKFRCDCADDQIKEVALFNPDIAYPEAPDIDFARSLDEDDDFLSEATLAILRAGNISTLNNDLEGPQLNPRRASWTDELGDLQI